LAIWLVSRGTRPRFAGWLLGAACAVALVLRYWLWSTHSDHGARPWDFFTVVYYPSYCRVEGLAIGVGLAALREYRRDAWRSLTGRPWILTMAGVGLVAVGWAAFDGRRQMVAAVFAFPLVSFGFGAFVAAALAPGFWLAERRIPGAAVIATASYTLYLTHKQMIHLSARLIDAHHAPLWMTVGLAVALMATASALLHFGVERPGLLVRDRLLHVSARSR
jgi:peptidoglycan/LPS O-acetylase OafA/YrhL